MKSRTCFLTALLLAVHLAIAQPAPPRQGAPYQAPGHPRQLKNEILWAGQCEEPAGSGLAFSGQSQVADDGQPHTRIKDDGVWKPIAEELQKNNPFQKQHDELWALRTRLKNVATKARFIFFKGRPEADERKSVVDQVNPELARIAEELATAPIRMKVDYGDVYLASQADFARRHIDAALPAIKPIAGRVTPESLVALRQAQQQLEIAAEALDAEPPPRVCSPIVYDAKTGLYVLFGGDHFDYLTNDTWVFDPARRRWMQRHPPAAPPPRGDHQLKAAGDGKVTLSGGFTYSSKTDYASNQYCHLADGEWVYDIEKNAWTGPTGAAAQPPDTRVYRAGPYVPEYFMQGGRPDAAANEAKLKALPPNTWMDMKTPHLLSLNRDWGTAALDTDRDRVIYWSGGHCVHSGSDVPHYHLASNRWELHFPIEMPLGLISASGVGVAGRNFTGRPWMSNHTDNCYAYDSGLKKLVVVGRNDQRRDRYTYLYDPDLGDWTERIRVPDGMNIGNMDVNVRSTPRGVLAWTRDPARLYLLDRATMKWAPIKFQAGAGVTFPAPMVDNCGLVYDPKRDRMLFVHKFYGEKSPFSGQVFALDFGTNKLEAITPAGADSVKWLFNSGQMREVVYDPRSDLFVWACWTADKSRMLVYDPSANRWAAAKVRGPAPFTVSTGLMYDPKRALIWLVHGAGRAGEVFVLRFDAAQAEIRPIGEPRGAAADPGGN